MPTFPIVGAHFRPPAKQILECLAASAPLWLEREPSNPYDENAIRVLCRPTAVSQSYHSTLEALLVGVGLTLEEFLEAPEFHLGYIPRTDAESISPFWASTHPGVQRFDATLTFTPAGKPAVQWEWPLGLSLGGPESTPVRTR